MKITPPDEEGRRSAGRLSALNPTEQGAGGVAVFENPRRT
jgi:hypothetical protein